MNYLITYVLTTAPEFKGRQWTMVDQDLSSIVYHDDGAPFTMDEIEAADAKLFIQNQAMQHLKDRAANMPATADLMQMLYADLSAANIAPTFCAAIAAVNDKYPAPTTGAI